MPRCMSRYATTQGSTASSPATIRNPSRLSGNYWAYKHHKHGRDQQRRQEPRGTTQEDSRLSDAVARFPPPPDQIARNNSSHRRVSRNSPQHPLGHGLSLERTI